MKSLASRGLRSGRLYLTCKLAKRAIVILLLLFFIFIPLAVVATLEPFWQRRVLEVVVLAYLFWLASRVAGYIRSISKQRKKPQELSWAVGQDASDFQLKFIRRVEPAGWRVISSLIVDPDRVGFTLQKRRRLVVVLCISSAAFLREWDVFQVQSWAQREGADIGAIVAASHKVGLSPGGVSPDSQNIKYLSFEDIREVTWIDRMLAESEKAAM